MRLSYLLPVVVLLSLACGSGRSGGPTVRDRACEGACEQGRERCVKECPSVGEKLCVAACDKVKDECVDRCQKP